MKLQRQLSSTAFDYLMNDGNFIISEIKSARATDEPFSLDIQIRVNDEVMVYRGTTCILTIKIKTQTKQIGFAAHKTYSDTFLKNYPFNNVPRGEITAYLKRTIPKVKARFFGNKQEGYYQNVLCHLHGEIADEKRPFIIFDRECVVGFEDNEEEAVFNLISENYQNIKTSLQNSNPPKYGVPNGHRFGNELDLLAIDEHCNLICIELKHGSNGSGIYWGALQSAVYHELFTQGIQTFFNDAKELIKQKVTLGLLPANALHYFNDKEKFNGVKLILAIAEPNFKKNCWDMIKDVINLVPENFRCDIITLNDKGDITPYTL